MDRDFTEGANELTWSEQMTGGQRVAIDHYRCEDRRRQDVSVHIGADSRLTTDWVLAKLSFGMTGWMRVIYMSDARAH